MSANFLFQNPAINQPTRVGNSRQVEVSCGLLLRSIMKTPIERFMEKLKPAANGCWLWIASKGNSGYGHFWVNGKFIDAHRFSYIWHNGEVPENKMVLHNCDNKLCVNPNHLKTGTAHDNMVDWNTRHPHSISPNFTFGGRHHTEEAKRNIAESAMGNKRCEGRALSKNTKRDSLGRFINSVTLRRI